MSELTWNGAAIEALVERALILGIDKTTSDAAIEAKRLCNRDTTALQGSIGPDHAVVNAEGQIEGAYGPHRADNPKTHEDIMTYAVYQEFLLGEQMPDGGTRTRNGGKPYMRPTIPKASEELPKNIAAAYRGLQ